MKYQRISAVIILMTAVVFLPYAGAQESSASTERSASRSFGGPESVHDQLEKQAEDADDQYIFTGLDKFWQPWYDWKRERSENNGFKIGFSAWFLYQHASEVLADENESFGGIYRLQGTWTLTGRDTRDHGGIEWRVEKRSAISDISPSQLSSEIGVSALNTGFLYSPNFRTDLSVINYTQRFADGTAGFAVGRLAFDAYLDPSAFQTINSGFMNRAFIVNPTLGTTGIGALGAVMKGFITDQFLVGVGVYDGNAESGEFDWDTIEEGEFIKSVEVNWSPSVDRYRTDRVQLTYWHKDARTKAGIKSGEGWVLSATYQVREKWLSFLRLGDSDGGAGTAAEKAVSTGFQYTPRENHALVVGVGWARPSPIDDQPQLRDEYVIEASYKFPFSRNFSLTPDVQLMFHPANNPDADRVWVIGIRGILAL